MPVHDWKRVKAGIFHDFHHAWIEEIKRALNRGLLPPDYYALAEQFTAGFGPDVLTLQSMSDESDNGAATASSKDGEGGLLLAPPRVRLVAETEMEFYRRKQKAVVIRHVSDDEIIAMVEIMSPSNKSGRKAIEAVVNKAAHLIDRRIHLVIVDVFPPTTRDPLGIHALIWEEITGEEGNGPAGKPLTLASYESEPGVRAYVERFAVGDALTDMPLFLEPGAHVPVPLEATYQAAWEALPARWRRVLEQPANQAS